MSSLITKQSQFYPQYFLFTKSPRYIFNVSAKIPKKIEVGSFLSNYLSFQAFLPVAGTKKLRQFCGIRIFLYLCRKGKSFVHKP